MRTSPASISKQTVPTNRYNMPILHPALDSTGVLQFSRAGTGHQEAIRASLVLARRELGDVVGSVAFIGRDCRNCTIRTAGLLQLWRCDGMGAARSNRRVGGRGSSFS